MEDLVTPSDIEREMVDITSRIDNAPSQLRDYHEKVRAARVSHKMAYALAYQSATGTQVDKKMQADLETRDTLEVLDQAEVEYKFATDIFDGLRTKLRALQSVSSLMKASMFGNHGGI